MSSNIKKKLKRISGYRQKSGKVPKSQQVTFTQSILQQALACQHAGRFSQAEEFYRKVLIAEPGHPRALNNLGLLAHQTGRSEIALDLINRALVSKPDYTEAHNNLGVILNELGKLEDAAASFRRALVLKPDSPELHYNLGNTLKDQGKQEEAVASLLWALSLKPDYAQAYNNLGIILKDQGKSDEAAASFHRAITLNPAYEDAHYNLGIILRDRGNLNEASASFRRTLGLNPDNCDAHYNLGIILKDQGKLDEAAASFRHAVSLNPDSAEAHNKLGITLNIQGRPDEAIASFRQAITLNPDCTEAHYYIGCILREMGKANDAIASLRKALSLKSDLTGAYAVLSSIVKHTEINEDVHAMEDLYNKKENLPLGDRINLGFALGKVFEDLREYDKSFAYVSEANLLKRQSITYSIQDDRELFARIKKTFSPEFFSSHKDSGYQARMPIFILGMPRSGTTLVEQIIASHPLVYGGGESVILEDLVDGICTGRAYPRFPECILEFGRDEFERMGSDYVKSTRHYSEYAEFITDKMLYNFLYVGLIKKILPNAKVVHCIRNPMDTCFSIFKRDFTGAHEYGYDLVELGQFYKLYKDLMAHWNRVLPGFMYTIRYEDIVADQRNQTENLLGFCGLPWDENCFAFYKKERTITTASFAQVRQPIYRDSVELWKRYEKYLQPLKTEINA